MKFIVGFLLLFSVQAFALELPERPDSPKDSVKFSWNIPTERENGAVLPVEEIGGYELYISKDGGETQSKLIKQGATTSFNWQNLQVGSYEATIRTFDTDGLYSKAAKPVLFEIEDASPPKEPSFFEAIIEFFSAFIDRIKALFA